MCSSSYQMTPSFVRSVLWAVACLLLGNAASVGNAAAPPSPPPRWPDQFHSGIRLPDVTGATQWVGRYYYSWKTQQACFLLSDAHTSRRVQVLVNQTKAYEIDLATGSCTVLSTAGVPLLSVLPPDFVTAKSFKYLAQEYHFYAPREGLPSHFLTQHWTLQNAQGQTLMNYYQNMHSLSPLRVEFATDAAFLFPQLMAFEPDFTAGFTDVPRDQVAWLLTVPQRCLSAKPAADSPTRANGGVDFVSSLMHPPRRLQQLLHKPRVESPGAVPIAKEWPQQFYTTQTFNHGIFDLPTLSGNTSMPPQITGTYYYDWPGNREASVWMDIPTQSLYRTVIADGSFKAIFSATNRCVIPPTGITGPLKPAWVHNLNYTDDWFLLRGTPGQYIRARHYQWDAFSAGPDHAFNYWETADADSTPMRFVGPTLEFPPYGTSASEYNSFTVGLDGIDTKTVFGYPSTCKSLREDQVPASWRRILQARANSPVPLPLYLPVQDLDPAVFLD